MILEGVGVRRGGRRLLADVDLHVASGERVAVVGLSGSGKTTLLHVLAGRLRPDVGTRTGPWTGWIPQDAGLVPYTEVRTNVLLGGLAGWGAWGTLRTLWPRRADRARARAALTRVGLGDRVHDSVDVLSGGERQRVALARVLFGGARGVVADEPVAALDPDLKDRALGQLLALTEGCALVVSSHDPRRAAAFFSRIVEVRGGRVVRDGPP